MNVLALRALLTSESARGVLGKVLGAASAVDIFASAASALDIKVGKTLDLKEYMRLIQSDPITAAFVLYDAALADEGVWDEVQRNPDLLSVFNTVRMQRAPTSAEIARKEERLEMLEDEFLAIKKMQAHFGPRFFYELRKAINCGDDTILEFERRKAEALKFL